MNTKSLIITSMLIALVSGFVGCEHNGGDNPIVPEEQTDVQRTVVYTVANNESSATLKTNAEWDELLNRFCDYAAQGAPVKFYSMSSAKSSHATKEKSTITTNSRDEIKAWMKEMEMQGRTVNVSYDEETGVWKGIAYAGLGNQRIEEGQSHTGTLIYAECPKLPNMPTGKAWALLVEPDKVYYLSIGGYLIVEPEFGSNIDVELVGDNEITLYGTVITQIDLDGNEYKIIELNTLGENSIAGEWKLVNLNKMVISSDGTMHMVDMYWWDIVADPIAYKLTTDGVASRTQASQTTTGTWSLSPEGLLCCDVFEDGGCWYINWCSPETLVLMRYDYNSTDGEVYYQMQLASNLPF